MRQHTSFLAAALLFGVVLSGAAAAQSAPAYITAAVNDAGRPADDKERDALRKPGECIQFSNMKPGMKVADFLPGEGYYTRIFSKVVGPGGHVYAILPEEFIKGHPRGQVAMQALVKQPAYAANTTLLVESTSDFHAPEPLDVVWTSLNYHDLHNKAFGPANMTSLNKTIFNALKPGGIYFIIDHAAAKGAGFSQTETLHRSDPDAVKKEVTAAGFVFDGESDILRNPNDNHTLTSLDPSLHDKTDEYIFRFRKP